MSTSLETAVETLRGLLANHATTSVDDLSAALCAVLTHPDTSHLLRLLEEPAPELPSEVTAVLQALALELRVQGGTWTGFEEATRRSLAAAPAISDPDLRATCQSYAELGRLIFLYESKRDFSEVERVAAGLAAAHGGYVRHMALTYRGLVAVESGDQRAALQYLREAGSVAADAALRLRGYSRHLWDRLTSRGMQGPELVAYAALLS